MELMHISLTGLIEKYETDFPFHFKLSILMDTCQGIQYLHSRNIIHRDLSSNNILLTKHLVAKVSDLGVAKAIPPGLDKHMVPGTMAFMPPEALKNEPLYGLPIDIFSMRCVCVHVVSMEWPMTKDQVSPDRTVLSEIEQREQYFVKLTHYPTLKLLVQWCLHDKPENRPEIGDVIKSLKNVNYNHHPHENDGIIELFSSVVTADELISQKNQELMIKDRQLTKQVNQKDELLLLKDQQLAERNQEIFHKDQKLCQQLRQKETKKSHKRMSL